MTDSEYYEAEIEPTLKELAAKCYKRGMAFTAHCQWGKTDFAFIEQAPHEDWIAMRMVQLANRAYGNVDVLLSMLAHDARKHKYESACLMLLQLKGAVK